MVAQLQVQRNCFQTCAAESKVNQTMSQLSVIEQPGTVFVDRRQRDAGTAPSGSERRQFRDGDRSARPEVAELANAVDDYKIARHRRFITFEELFDVMASLGYHK